MCCVMVGTPIRQKPEILREFLTSLEGLECEGFRLCFCFVDDNDSPESKQLLEGFLRKYEGCCEILYPSRDTSSHYACDERTHHWKEENVWKVAAYKDWILQKAQEANIEALFFADSDLILHPKTIKQLLQSGKEIISNIFWTKWVENSPPLPQVWVSDHYTLFEREIAEEITEPEALKRQERFLSILQTPGIYQVGGLGACTLIRRSALEKGMSFSRIYNVTFWGEDRHFCIRAVAKGLELYVDTHYPAYHIYRQSDLSGVTEYRRRSALPPRITLSMIVKNEEGRYLRQMLEAAREYINDAVIIDDASDDKTADLCEEILKGIPLRLIRNPVSRFSCESDLRKQQWDETQKMNPDWILALDADEIFEKQAAQEIKKLAGDPTADSYFFRLYDFWSETHFRSDRYWAAHLAYRPFMIRNRPGMRVVWNQMAQHCGRFPSLECFQAKRSDLRLKHYGWAKAEDRVAKWERYKRLDPEAKYGWREQYDSILDSNPNLILWTEGD